MGTAKRPSAAEIRRFLQASKGIDFSGRDRSGVYRWIEETLQWYRYSRQSKEVRGVLREFIIKMTGLSVPVVTRLVGCYLGTGQVRERIPAASLCSAVPPGRHPVAGRRGRGARWLSRPATKKILEREWEVFHKPQFQRLAGISVSHSYNLRQTTTCRLPGDG